MDPLGHSKQARADEVRNLHQLELKMLMGLDYHMEAGALKASKRLHSRKNPQIWLEEYILQISVRTPI